VSSKQLKRLQIQEMLAVVATCVTMPCSAPDFPHQLRFLPEELLHRVFLNLDQASLARCRQVCRQWNNVASSVALWRRVRLSGHRLETPLWPALLASGRLVSLELVELQGWHRLADSLSQAPCLMRLLVNFDDRVSDLEFGDDFLSRLAVCDQLRCLCIGGRVLLTDTGLADTVRQFPCLETLFLGATACPGWEGVSLAGRADAIDLRRLTERPAEYPAGQLTRVVLSGLPSVTAEGILAALRLTAVVDSADCADADDFNNDFGDDYNHQFVAVGFDVDMEMAPGRLARPAPRLAWLPLRELGIRARHPINGATGLAPAIARAAPKLNRLDLDWGRAPSKADLAALAEFAPPQLASLAISFRDLFEPSLTSLLAACPRLRRLCARDLPRLGDLSADLSGLAMLPQLTELCLHFSYGAFSADRLVTCLAGCHRLACLSLFAQEFGPAGRAGRPLDGLSRLLPKLGRLRQLTLCITSLTDALLAEEILPACPPSLASLRLQSCADVTGRGLAAACANLPAGLVELELHDCAHLTDDCVAALVDACPRLRCLRLLDCPGVSRCRLASRVDAWSRERAPAGFELDCCDSGCRVQSVPPFLLA
ncbi:hypothetical protein BOX15_Mlig020554g1, partial [Macrostomum lignano]